LLTQRFDDLNIALLRQRVALDTYGGLLQDIRESVAPEIDNLVVQLEEMAAGIRAVGGRVGNDDGRADELRAVFSDRLTLMTEHAEVEHDCEEAKELDRELRGANERLVERLNVDEEAEFPELVARLQAAIDSARERMEMIKSRAPLREVQSGFPRRESASARGGEQAWRDRSPRHSVTQAPSEDAGGEHVLPGLAQSAPDLPIKEIV
jgi:chromosome segregation ATPase